MSSIDIYLWLIFYNLLSELVTPIRVDNSGTVHKASYNHTIDSVFGISISI